MHSDEPQAVENRKFSELSRRKESFVGSVGKWADWGYR